MDTGITVLDEEPDATALQAIQDGLDATMPEDAGPYRLQPLSVLARRGGRLVGGIYGHTVWRWYQIRHVWIDPSCRGSGLGRRLLSRAEDEARARGCRYARLDTSSFQAPGFYRKCGYAEAVRFPDFPTGHSVHWLIKPLVEDPHPDYLRLPRVPLEIATERLRLRQFREDDLDDLARLNADPDFARFVGGGQDRAASWRQLALLIGHWRIRGYGWYAVTLAGSDRMIGRIGHWYPEGWPELEIGWALDPALWGRGLAVEGARACLAVARDGLGLASVVSLIHPDNRASQRVCEKLGGTMERAYDLGGVRVDIWRTPTD